MIGSTLANAGGYLFHLLMGRMLGPSDYGVLVSLISLLYLISVATTTIETVVVRYVSSCRARGTQEAILPLFLFFYKIFLPASFCIFIFFICLNTPIANFLNISSSAAKTALIIVGFNLLDKLVTPVNSGITRGLQNFSFLSLNSVLNIIFRLTIGVILVSLGFSVLGAILGFVIADFLTYFISFYPIRSIFKYRNKSAKIQIRRSELLIFPIFLTTLGLTSLYSTDILLVKHFFEPDQAGIYGAVASLGKIVVFASGVIPSVLMPLSTEKHERGEKNSRILLQSLLLVSLMSFCITSVYFLFPDLMISSLYGNSYLSASKYLGQFAIFISLYSVINLLAFYFLSIKQKLPSLLIMFSAILQIIIIAIFHQSISQVINISIIISALLAGALLLYYFQNDKPKR